MTTADTLNVAAAQISSAADPQINLKAIADAIGRADGADIVVLPEASMARFGTDLRAVAQPLDGSWANEVRALARQAGIVVVVGMFEPAPDGRVYNTLLATGPGVEAAYRKIHLFDAFGSRESDLVAPGHERVMVDVRGVRVGLATCFDLRFADQFTALGRDGAELVVVPASWGSGPGKEEQWDLLTRARATDAQAWLLACDQAWVPPTGSDPLGVGRSVLVDPLGEVRARLGQAPGMLRAQVDVEIVRTVRERVPVL
jgi:predicted amidohydrolase